MANASLAHHRNLDQEPTCSLEVSFKNKNLFNFLPIEYQSVLVKNCPNVFPTIVLFFSNLVE